MEFKELKRLGKSWSKEQLDYIYTLYVEGYSIKQLSNFYNADISYQFKRYNYDLNNTFKLKRKCNFKKYRLKSLLDEVNDETSAYFLGLMYSDGYTSESQIGIKLQKRDVSVLQKVVDYFFEDGYEVLVYNNTAEIKISSKYMVDNLRDKWGCLESKTYKELTVPNISSELIRHFIRGYFDGDGTIFFSKNGFKANICSINIKLLEDFKVIFNANNIECTINTEIREGKTFNIIGNIAANNCKNMHRLYVRKKEALITFYNYMYKDATIYIERKKDKYDSFFVHYKDYLHSKRVEKIINK